MHSTALIRPAVGSSRPLVAPLLALLLFLLPLAALAQVPAPAPASPPATAQPAAEQDKTVAELEALVGTLTDEAARTKLVDQLKTLIEARRATAEPKQDAGAGAEFLGRLTNEVGRIGQQFVGAAEFIVDLPQVFGWATTGIGDPTMRKALIDFAMALVIVLAAAIATEWIVRRVLTRPRRAVESKHHDRLVVRLSFVFVRLLLDLLPVLAFALVAHAAMAFLDPPWRIRLAVLALVQANVVVRLIGVAARSLLAPEFASLRLLGVGDQTAQYIYIWVRRIAAVAVYGYFFIEALYALGAPYDVYTVLLKLLGFVVTVLMIVLILQNRQPVAEAIRGHGQPGGMRTLRARFGDVWHVFAITYVVVVFAIWAVQLEQGFSFLFRATLLTVGVLLLARLVAAIVRQLLERGFAISPEVKQRYPGIEERANRFLPVLRYILLGTVYAITLLALLQVWGVDSFGWVASDSGRVFVGGAAKIVMVLLVALVCWAMLSAAIERYLNSADMDGNMIQRSQRVRTLLPLMQKTAFVGITIIAGLIVLSEIGIDIGPLLAGAGIIGLAVGFGAQTLVKDIITGIFILVENQFSVGHPVARLRRHRLHRAVQRSRYDGESDEGVLLLRRRRRRGLSRGHRPGGRGAARHPGRDDRRPGLRFEDPGAARRRRRRQVRRLRRHREGPHQDAADPAVGRRAGVQSPDEEEVRRAGHRDPLPTPHDLFRRGQERRRAAGAHRGRRPEPDAGSGAGGAAPHRRNRRGIRAGGRCAERQGRPGHRAGLALSGCVLSQ